MPTTYNSSLITYNSFYYYLKDESLKESTITEHINNVERFNQWSEENNFAGIQHINYNELLSYVQQLKKQSLTVSTINIRITSINKYYEHLKQEGIIEKNPARRLRIKGTVKKIIINPFSYTELQTLYHEYAKPKDNYFAEKSKIAHKKNTVLLSLMIEQALHSGELTKLEQEYINLNKGIIYIPSTGRSNSRELKLESKQIIILHDYLTQTKFHSSKLFKGRVNDLERDLLNTLKGINPVIRNAAHIRASVILHWLKMYDKRTVQYMTGHKWIGSTEHYQVQELTGLTDLLEKHHPFS